MKHPETCYCVQCPDCGKLAYVHAETKHDARAILRDHDWGQVEEEWVCPWETQNPNRSPWGFYDSEPERDEPKVAEILTAEQQEHALTDEESIPHRFARPRPGGGTPA